MRYPVGMAPRSRYGAPAVRIYRAWIDPLIGPLRPRIVRVCRELGAERVLDIASATGAQCRALARAGIRATGLDLSEAMVAAAKRRSPKENPDYVQGSAYELPFLSGSFDAALLVLALHEHTEAERAVMLGEALRVVRRSGHLIVADYERPARAGARPVWAGIGLIEHLAGGEHRAGFRDFVARGSLGGLLDRHGLRPTRVIRSHAGTIVLAVVRKAGAGNAGRDLTPASPVQRMGDESTTRRAHAPSESVRRR